MARKKQKGNGAGTVYPRKNKQGKITAIVAATRCRPPIARRGVLSLRQDQGRDAGGLAAERLHRIAADFRVIPYGEYEVS